MPLLCPIQPNDRSSLTATITFTDENGDAFVPKTLKWSLFNYKGTVINGRTDVTIGSPAATLTVELYDADLAYSSGPDIYLLVEATYDSALVSDKTFKETYKITIQDLVGVA